MKKTFYGIVDTVTEGSRIDIFSRIAKGSTKEEAIEEAKLEWWKYTTPRERKVRELTVREVTIDITEDMEEGDIKDATMEALDASEDYIFLLDKNSKEYEDEEDEDEDE